MTTENELDYPIILAAVDDSELGQLTLANAIHQAHEDGAVLIIASIFEKDQLNVFDALSKERTTDARTDVENALKRYRQEALDAGVKTVATVLRDGEPGKVIVRDIIPVIEPNLVVIGAHSKRSLSDRYFGTQSGYVAANAPVTVMVVRQ